MMFSPKDLLILKIAVQNWRSLAEITETQAEDLLKKIDELPTEPFPPADASNVSETYAPDAPR